MISLAWGNRPTAGLNCTDHFIAARHSGSRAAAVPRRSADSPDLAGPPAPDGAAEITSAWL